jgi:hypothetical protein
MLPAATAFAQDDEDEEAEGEPPAGDYTVAITEDDIPSDLVNGPDLIGRWQFFLRPDGSYSLGRADIGEVVTGSYAVEDETITVTDEAGLLSCVNSLPTAGGDGPPVSGTYNWELNDDGLTLRALEEGCAGRRLLLATRPLDFFVACSTEAVEIPPPVVAGDDGAPTDEEDEEDADAEEEADEEADAEEDADAEEEAAGEDEGEGEDDGDRVLDDPFGGGDNGDGGEPDQEGAEDGIDGLLAQLSACWTTQDPARILPLFGSDFLNALVDQTGSLYDVAGIFGQIMAVPIRWERAGEVELEGTEASSLVSQTIGAEESFVRFLFVFEDGEWKLNSFG